MTRPLACLFASTLLLSAPAVLAQDETVETIPVASEKPAEGDEPVRGSSADEDNVTYSGFGLTRVSTDFDNLEDAVNLDGTLGVRVPNFDWVAAELNLSFTVIPGENSNEGGLIGGGGGSEGNCVVDNPPTPPGCTPATPGSEPQTTGDLDDFQMQGIGAYVVLKNPGRFYGMAKIGYAYQVTTIEELDDRGRNGTAYMLGAGYRYGKTLGGVELVYQRLLNDVDGIGLNITYGFGGRRDRDRDRDDD